MKKQEKVKSPPSPLERKQHMVNVWVGKEIGPELDAAADIEAKRSGMPFTRISLARAIFLWAFDLYRRAGSMACLKAAHVLFPSARFSLETQERAFRDLEEIFKLAPSPTIEEVTRDLAERAERWKKSRGG